MHSWVVGELLAVLVAAGVVAAPPKLRSKFADVDVGSDVALIAGRALHTSQGQLCSDHTGLLRQSELGSPNTARALAHQALDTSFNVFRVPTN